MISVEQEGKWITVIKTAVIVRAVGFRFEVNQELYDKRPAACLIVLVQF